MHITAGTSPKKISLAHPIFKKFKNKVLTEHIIDDKMYYRRVF